VHRETNIILQTTAQLSPGRSTVAARPVPARSLRQINSLRKLTGNSMAGTRSLDLASLIVLGSYASKHRVRSMNPIVQLSGGYPAAAERHRRGINYVRPPKSFPSRSAVLSSDLKSVQRREYTDCPRIVTSPPFPLH